MAYQLTEPILEGGIQNSHFFNGRLLTADALSDEQIANRKQRRQLGRAIGYGIVEGLTVRLLSNGDSPVVRVTAGLALNREGEALALPDDADVALVEIEEARPTDAGLFRVCNGAPTSTRRSGRHVYILVMAPASGYRGRAPMYDLSVNGDTNGMANGCGYRYEKEGVQFRLVWVDRTDTTVIDPDTAATLNAIIGDDSVAGQSCLRNRLAHLCLGTAESRAVPVDLVSTLDGSATAPSYGLLDRLLTEDPNADLTVHLNPCDVPLALIYWTPAGIQFIDLWSVRRRIVKPFPATAGWPFVSDRRPAEGEAAFLQFQAHLAFLTGPSFSQSQIVSIRAMSYFHYLPAAGVLPLVSGLSTRGLNLGTFFAGMVIRPPAYIEGDQVQPLLRQSFVYDPINPQDSEFLWLYVVRDNQQSILTDPERGSMSYLIFASGHLPPFGCSRYDLARAEFSNFT